MEVLPANHWLFQLANSFLLLSYVSRNILQLRILLSLAGLCFFLWGLLVLSVSLDTTIWNGVFFIINALQALRIIYEKRPIKFSDPRHEVLYLKIFQPVGITRRDFKILADSALIRSLKAGSMYIEQGNEAHNLSLIQKGSMVVMKRVVSPDDPTKTEDTVVNTAKEYEFVESPEFASRFLEGKEGIPETPKELTKLQRLRNKFLQTFQRTRINRVGNQDDDLEHGSSRNSLEFDDDSVGHKVMKVSIKAVTDCVFLTWPVESLMKLLKQMPHIQAPLGSIIGADVAVKLFRQTSKVKSSYRDLQYKVYGVPLIGSQPLSAEDVQMYEILKERLDIDFTIEDAKMLFQLAKRRKIRRKGTVLIRQGEEATHLGLIYEGEAVAVQEESGEESIVYRIKQEEFIGSLEFLDRGHEHLGHYTIKSLGRISMLQWDIQDLQVFLHQKPQIHTLVNSLLALDIASKFHSTVGRKREGLEEEEEEEQILELEEEEEEEKQHLHAKKGKKTKKQSLHKARRGE